MELLMALAVGALFGIAIFQILRRNMIRSVIGLTLLVPTLVIGFWPRVAIDFYEASTNSLALELAGRASLAMAGFSATG